MFCIDLSTTCVDDLMQQLLFDRAWWPTAQTQFGESWTQFVNSAFYAASVSACRLTRNEWMNELCSS
jgi:hypothetical protein